MSISPEQNKSIKISTSPFNPLANDGLTNIKISTSPFNPLANDGVSSIKIAGQNKDTNLPAHKRRLIRRSTKLARHSQNTQDSL
jgi:hypothetical protein